MPEPIRIGVLGATGRMGRAVTVATAADPRFAVGALIERSGAHGVGQDGGLLNAIDPLNVLIDDDLERALPYFDVLVDFTRPQATVIASAICAQQGKAMVIGTTGMSAQERTKVEVAAKTAPIVLAANFSIGVNLLLTLVGTAARVLGDTVDVEIVEAHHRHKVDAPSGTALQLGRAAAQALGRDLARDGVYAREGQTGERKRREIGFATVRGGDVVGDHTVMFLGDGERVEISHRATSRANFANGALRAAAWVRGRAPGLYSMRDVLGI